jgi:hypothetical protein
MTKQKKMHNLFADTQCLVEEQNLETAAAAVALAQWQH